MIPVIFSCLDYWVVYKPADMNFHTESDELGIMSCLAAEHPDKTFFPVHRLDKMTSGLLIVACHKEAAAEFGKMFENREIEKRYLALSDKKPKKKQGTVSGGMKQSRRGQWKLTKEKDSFSITQFFCFLWEGKRLFIVRPLTGRTHQIRVALKSLGSPILGDVRYGGAQTDRGYLHAYSLQFSWQGKNVSYSSLPNSGELFSQNLASFLTSQCHESMLKWPSKK